MKFLTPLSALTFLVFTPAYAHLAAEESSNAWLRWLGNYHFIFLHFPIALILMTGVAELLFSWKKNPQYSFVANFLLISAAVLVVPTVFSGLSLEESGAIIKETHPLLEWHEIFGFVTLSLTVITLCLRNFVQKRSLYLCCLFLLLACVMVTSHLGGLMAFKDYHLLPPFFTFGAVPISTH